MIQHENSIDPSAELRLIHYSKISSLEEATDFIIIEIEKKKFWKTTIEKQIIDNYNDFLITETNLIDSLNRAFLTFYDLVQFLQFKNIVLNNFLYNNIVEKLEKEREETALFLNSNDAIQLYEKLHNLVITEEDLKQCDIDNLGDFDDSLYRKQKEEILKLKNALKMVDKYSVLFIRILD